jgi:hypothetical protein
MREKRKGPIARAAGLAEGVAATVRRMQREREPRVLVYDATGYARVVQPDARGHERLLEIAETMVSIAAGEDVTPRTRRPADDGEKPRRQARKTTPEETPLATERKASARSKRRTKQESSERKASSAKRRPKRSSKRRRASEDGA